MQLKLVRYKNTNPSPKVLSFLIKICCTATFLIPPNVILAILVVVSILFHELKTHNIPIFSGTQAAEAVGKAASTTSSTPAKVNKGRLDQSDKNRQNSQCL